MMKIFFLFNNSNAKFMFNQWLNNLKNLKMIIIKIIVFIPDYNYV